MGRGFILKRIFLGTLGLGAGCAHLPETPVDRALYLDLRRIVDTREQLGWVIDQVEFDATASVTLRSMCQVAPERRQAVKTWLDEKITEMGGSARAVYENAGKDLDAATDILTYERVRGLLLYGESRIDECPFWLEADTEFAGVQSSGERFVFVLESAGYGGLFISPGETRFGGGGGARIVPSWGISDRWLVGAGFEVGGNGFFSEGQGSQTLSTVFSAAVPVLVRLRDLSWVVDVEIMPIVWFTPDQFEFKPGIRVAAGVGLSTVRLAAFMPVGLLRISYEYHPERSSGLPETHFIGVGTKVGFEVSF